MSNAKQKDEAPASGTNAATCGVSVRRIGNVVHLSLSAADDYRAIEFYERLVESAKKGKLQFDLNVAVPS